MNRLSEFMTKNKLKVEQVLLNAITSLDCPEKLQEAMIYSVKAGGKRIRPLLVMATAQSFDRNPERALEAGAALEMIHTYSLIHDDLPSMDDDDLRRGQPTNHKVFGEAFAILAGDALLTLSFGIIADSVNFTPEEKVKLIGLLAKASGAEGMVGGQAADIEGEEADLTIKELESIHVRKTGRLLEYAVKAGGIISGLDDRELNLLGDYAKHIGLAFQIRDDILDVEGDQNEIGKPVGSDEANKKSTYPALLGMEEAKRKLQYHIEKAHESLQKIHPEPDLLADIADLIASRTS
ncbi:polyprenyl synthetase family protein [Jeotgalibacillus aurantiacus]|uniref:polyprenyl synthetase family protein n=1 Tax=Jeotgalibacillus aurantiacus TaxID=2763266 RepID=UPI001D09DC3E|nr:farnesyl diphosphate synthase [Jeotgalibacillus aurantiacus]